MSNPFDVLAEDHGLSDQHIAAMEFFVGLKEKLSSAKPKFDTSIAASVKKDITAAKKKDQVKLRSAIAAKGVKTPSASVRKLPKVDRGGDVKVDTGAKAIAQQKVNVKTHPTGNRAQNMSAAKAKLKKGLRARTKTQGFTSSLPT